MRKEYQFGVRGGHVWSLETDVHWESVIALVTDVDSIFDLFLNELKKSVFFSFFVINMYMLYSCWMLDEFFGQLAIFVNALIPQVQHSHSRHQKTTSTLLRINLKGILKFNEVWPLEGATCMYSNSMVEFSAASRKCYFYAENWWFQTKRFTGLLELIQLYKINSLQILFPSFSPFTKTIHWLKFTKYRHNFIHFNMIIKAYYNKIFLIFVFLLAVSLQLSVFFLFSYPFFSFSSLFLFFLLLSFFLFSLPFVLSIFLSFFLPFFPSSFSYAHHFIHLIYLLRSVFLSVVLLLV